METHIEFYNPYLWHSFKSYYVVWKLEHNSSEEYIVDCLNRTMQYGNFVAPTRLRCSMKFKSYYVVWKQLCCERNTNANNSFKSYYVVWKRNANISSIKFSRKFKSYYVVWKLEAISSAIQSYVSLNRTMQYGNP